MQVGKVNSSSQLKGDLKLTSISIVPNLNLSPGRERQEKFNPKRVMLVDSFGASLSNLVTFLMHANWFRFRRWISLTGPSPIEIFNHVCGITMRRMVPASPFIQQFIHCPCLADFGRAREPFHNFRSDFFPNGKSSIESLSKPKSQQRFDPGHRYL